MDQQLNNRENEFLWKLLVNPADPGNSHADDLQLLINDFPQSGVLRALLASRGDGQAVTHAAAYFNRTATYKLVNSPDSLAIVTAGQIIYIDEQLPAVNTYFNAPASKSVLPHVEETVNKDTPEANEALVEQDDVINNSPVSNNEALITADAVLPHQPAGSDQNAASGGSETDTALLTGENLLAKEYEAHLAKTSEAERNEPVYTFNDQVEYFHQDIDDEIYDEIVSIEDINLEQLANYNSTVVKEEEEQKNTLPDLGTEETDTPAEDKYFVFDSSFTEHKQQAESTEPVQTAEEKQDLQDTSTKDISRYNDEKMPYTFLWWLDKTRKEHAEVYQPYAVNNKPAFATKKDIPDELQQQYYENIFNINSVNELDQSTQPQSGITHQERKEDKIIERFIQQEPQIQHPSGIKLDNENKAKKSSEDRDELVTETLARIYTEQMLYHKAILTYKKLMLKFPEKSLYFAGYIEQLEKKIN